MPKAKTSQVGLLLDHLAETGTPFYTTMKPGDIHAKNKRRSAGQIPLSIRQVLIFDPKSETVTKAAIVAKKGSLD